MHELQFDNADGVMHGLLVAEIKLEKLSIVITFIKKILGIISVFEAILLC